MAVPKAPLKSSAKAKSSKKTPKEKVFHPESRKAGRLERKLLRKNKLEHAGVLKSHRKAEQVDRHVFFLHAIPPEALSLTLSEMHAIIRDVWLTRHDTSIEAEQAARRKGRPRSTKEDKLLEERFRDEEEYRTGIEIPDLTYAPNVALFRQWTADNPAFLHSLRWIRISSENPSSAPVTRPGERKALANAASAAGISMPDDDDDEQMAEVGEEAEEGDELADLLDVAQLSVDPLAPVSTRTVDSLSHELEDLL